MSPPEVAPQLPTRALAGCRALVTGTNRGIGRAVVARLAVDGADILAHTRQGDSAFRAELAATSDVHQVSITPLYFDLADPQGMATALSEALPGRTRIDILVNSAGVAHGGYLAMTSVQTVREVFQINYFAQLAITQFILRRMTRQGHGAVVNVGSIAGLDMHAGNVAYGASKAALMAATCSLAAEVGPLGIRVNAVAPGLADTDMAKLMEPAAGAAMVAASALGRMATAEEVAEVIAFLVSDRASFINGQVIRVDGGRL